MARENQATVEYRSCVTCKHGMVVHIEDIEKINYTTKEECRIKTYTCNAGHYPDCQGSYELGKHWEPREGVL